MGHSWWSLVTRDYVTRDQWPSGVTYIVINPRKNGFTAGEIFVTRFWLSVDRQSTISIFMVVEDCASSRSSASVLKKEAMKEEHFQTKNLLRFYALPFWQVDFTRVFNTILLWPKHASLSCKPWFLFLFPFHFVFKQTIPITVKMCFKVHLSDSMCNGWWDQNRSIYKPFPKTLLCRVYMYAK